jgi:Flp pilus assembly protein TadG
MKTISCMWLRIRLSIFELASDCSGIAATEFAFIVPLMLVMFFGTVEFSSGVASDRKVSLMARTLADLTSQNTSVTLTQLQNFFNASNAIMWPYVSSPPPTPNPVNSTISELYIDPATGVARVQWSQGSAPRTVGAPAPLPASLIGTDPNTHAILPNQYFLFSEVNFQYVPTIAYGMMPTGGINLSDVAYTRPRQSTCVFYPPPTTSNPPCPTS